MLVERIGHVPCVQRGRYLVGEAIGEGGMATVHVGRLAGEAGFSRIVAVKCLRSELACDVQLRNQLVDEARMVSRVRHGNVVQMLDVIVEDEQRLLVLEYVPGANLAYLRRTAGQNGELVPPRIASAILFGALRGLHAAHEAMDEERRSLGIVHRDVSPQNLLVGTDGESRVLDFGIAKAENRLYETSPQSDVRGKLAYMAPEQFTGEGVDRRTDLFSAAVVLWESLTGQRLFATDEPATTMGAVLHGEVPRLAGRIAGATPALDGVLARALAKNPNERFPSADQMARALETVLPPASPRMVAAWVQRIARVALDEREQCIASFERAAVRAQAPVPAEDQHTAELSTLCRPRSWPPLADPRLPAATIPDDIWSALAIAGASATLTPPPVVDPCLPRFVIPDGVPRPPLLRCETPLAMSAAVTTGEILAWRHDTDPPPPGLGMDLAHEPAARAARPIMKWALVSVMLPLIAMAAVLSERSGPHARLFGGASTAVAAAAATPPLAAALPPAAAPVAIAPTAAPTAAPLATGTACPLAAPVKARHRAPSSAPMPLPVRLPLRVE